MENGRTTMIKRIFAVVLAFAVAVSILTVPVQETYEPTSRTCEAEL